MTAVLKYFYLNLPVCLFANSLRKDALFIHLQFNVVERPQDKLVCVFFSCMLIIRIVVRGAEEN